MEVADIDKKSYTEQDIRTKYITPAIQNVGWDIQTQLLEEVYLTKGRIIVKGHLAKRGKAKKADYVLYHKPNIPVAVVEAKDNNHAVGDGMQQALEYAEMLDVPFAYSSNGDAFLEHDRTGKTDQVECELSIDSFPSPEELWKRYCGIKGIKEEDSPVVTQDYYSDISGKAPRYYQMVAINKAIEAISKGQNRILLVMATGTGKTYTAFQIIWRLWKSKTKKRILFLADRNILVDQTITNDFKPFEQAMTKIKHHNVDKSYEIYLSLYQAVTGTEEEMNVYKQFSPDFFDLIVVDECHRGSAAADSAWREILEYFSSATQIGMTATPRETKYVSNIDYFGEPVYFYTLRQGIEDGFLAPYKVIRIDLDKDLVGWRPEKGKLDKHGLEIEDRVYNQKDFDKTLILEKRTELVAKKVTEFLKGTNRMDKTIIFCEDIDHAERMRSLMVNENADLAAKNRKYVMRITGDNPEGKLELDSFINPEELFPVVTTTSKLMGTGVDAQTCKLIVLDKRIQSLTEFKQIIGRGTRINEDYGKFYFTIIDFRKATELFADPGFDGEPVQIYEPDGGEVVPPDYGGDNGNGGEEPPGPEPGKRVKYVVGDVPVYVVAERVQYYGKDGKLITESLKDYTSRIVLEEYESIEGFLKKWDKAKRKQAIVKELEDRGVIFEALADKVGRDYDPFDLICHIVYDQPPLTRRERAQNVKKRNYFTEYGENARLVLDGLLDKYADEGIENIESMNVLRVQPIDSLGTPVEIINSFGGKREYLKALRELKKELYSAA